MGLFRRRTPPPATPGPEVRAPQAGTIVRTTASPYLGAPMVPEWDADTAVRAAYYANTYVWACAAAIAKDLTSIPLRAGSDPEKPDQYNTRSPILTLLGPGTGRANTGKLSARRLLAWTVVQRLITGRWCWEIETTPTGRPLGFWPIPSGSVQPIPAQPVRDRDGRIVRTPSRYFDSLQINTAEGPIILPIDRAYYDWHPSQTDVRQPESCLQAARLDVSVAVMQDRYDRAFLMNEAAPAHIVAHEEFALASDTDKWRGQYRESFQGPDNAGGTMFVGTSPSGAKPSEALAVYTIGMSQRDAEFIKRYESKVRAICVAFGVPLSRLGDASGSTFNNSGAEGQHYWRSTIWDLAVEFAESLNAHLAPLFGSDVLWFARQEHEHLRDPQVFAVPDLIGAVGSDIVTVDEARRYIDPRLGPHPDPAPSAAERAQMAADATAALEAARQQQQQSADPTPADSNTPVDATPPQRHRRDTPAPSPVVNPWGRRAAQWRSTSVDQGSLEVLFRYRMQAVLDRQAASVQSRLASARGARAVRSAASVDDVYDPAYWETRTADEMRPLIEQAFTLAAGRLAVTLPGDLVPDVTAPYAQRFIEQRANQLAGNVTATTYEAIKGELAAGVAEGEGIPELSRRIRGLFEQTWAHRAETVARTEVVGAYNGSALSYMVGEVSDLLDGVEWIATRDSRVRDTHAEADGQVVPVGGRFNVGGASMAYPGDPSAPAGEVVNCRCTIAPVVAKQRARRHVPVEAVENALRQLALGRCDHRAALTMAGVR